MSKKLKELKEKRAGLYAQIDSLRKETDGREMTAEEQQRWDTLFADYEKADKAVAAEEKFLDIQRRQAEEAYRQNNGGAAGAAAGKDTPEYRRAFADYLLNGAQGISPETRSLIEKRDSISGLSAGVLIPTDLASSIEIALKSYGGMFEAGQIITTSKGGDLTFPTVNDTAAKATIVAEYDQSTKRTPTFGSVTLKAFTYRTPIIPVSLELLQDSAFDLDALLSQLLSESFGRGVNEHLTTGSGTGQPRGIVTAATAIENGAAAGAITLDNIIDLIAGVDSAYAKTGKFMFNHKTLWALAKIKDTHGQYIWQENARVGQPGTIFGKGYVINDDVADIGAGNASVLFGDLSKYKIRLVKGFRVIRLNELLAEYLSIGLFGFARVDGTLIDAGTHPVVKLVHAS
ncbi:MAG: phage major capsid protein [Candidatus Cryptobacteroides sp.]|jgi:HK97 family phage major capsid protein